MQPDFTELFFQTFRGAPRPLQYHVRPGPNLLHDLAFLSSLTHDARILSPGVQLNDHAMCVLMSRDCWELGYTDRKGATELHVVGAQLQFTGVRSVEWHCGESPDDPLWLDHLWIDSEYRRDLPFSFYLVGEDWKCTVGVAPDEWGVHLVDMGAIQ